MPGGLNASFEGRTDRYFTETKANRDKKERDKRIEAELEGEAFDEWHDHEHDFTGCSSYEIAQMAWDEARRRMWEIYRDFEIDSEKVKPPTEKQLSYLRYLGWGNKKPDSKEEDSAIISALKERKESLEESRKKCIENHKRNILNEID
jgi:hypothetical protein